jgi:hypothetical protein
MMDRLVGAIPNPPEAVAAAPSLPAVLLVVPSLDPTVGTFPLLAVVLGGGGGPQPSGLTHRSGMAPRSPNPDNSSVRYKRSRRPDRYADSDRRPWAGDSNSGPPPEVVPGGGCAGGLTCDS